jgi:hypothetical protein
MVYRVGMKAYEKGDGMGLISIDTDGVCATVPFDPSDLPNGVGEGLGQWKLEKWTGIFQWQNGIYWLRDSDGNWKEPKSRGIPKGSIPFDAATKALEAMDFSARPFTYARLSLTRTRFIGYRQAIRGQFSKWRKWVKEEYDVSMGGRAGGKAVHHFAECRACDHFNPPGWKARNRPPVKLAASMHTVSHMPDMPHNGKVPGIDSYPHKLPWLEEQPDLPPGFVEDHFNLIVKDEDM